MPRIYGLTWLKTHRRQLFIAIGALIGVSAIVQSFYPTNRLVPYSSIDGVNVSAWKLRDATWELNHRMKTQPIAVHVGEAKETYATPKPVEIGLSVSNQSRVNNHRYPWYARLLPASLLWYHYVQPDGAPTYKSDTHTAATYLEKKLGDSCNIPPKNASLRYADKKLQVISAKNGGTCKESEAIAALRHVRPRLDKPSVVTIPVAVSKPKITDSTAREVATSLTKNSDGGVKIVVAGKTQTIKQSDVLSWLDFTTKKDTLTYSIDQTRANDYMKTQVTPKVSKPRGTTKITTRDFTVISQKTGATGRTLALPETLATIKAVLEGNKSSAKANTTDVPPVVDYTRTYTHTSTGIAALIAQYDTDHPGVFGVSFQELDGAGRSAQHDGTKQFTTASTYKLFVAYGTLRNIDAGKWKWSDKNISDGRNLSSCFDDMIVKSDNACGEALLKKLGLTQLTNDIHALGLTSSGFTTGDTPVTTPNDLALYLTKLQQGSLPIKSASRDRLLSAMKRQVYRQGIPAGASGAVADKVGFLWKLLHDAAIVYSPKGTYVLVVMTDGSAWANIAELTQ